MEAGLSRPRILGRRGGHRTPPGPEGSNGRWSSVRPGIVGRLVYVLAAPPERAFPPHGLPRPRPQVPAPALRPDVRPGARGADALQRAQDGPARARLPV